MILFKHPVSEQALLRMKQCPQPGHWTVVEARPDAVYGLKPLGRARSRAHMDGPNTPGRWSWRSPPPGCRSVERTRSRRWAWEICNPQAPINTINEMNRRREARLNMTFPSANQAQCPDVRLCCPRVCSRTQCPSRESTTLRIIW